jgi:radical SAM protein with 4Fe4S-binding SPASM domain
MPAFAEVHAETRKPFYFSTVDRKRKPLSLWRTPEEFFERFHSNPCLAGAFEISLDGAVRPCVGCEHHCGKVSQGDLRAGLRDSSLYETWKTTKEYVQQCADCPLALACSGCLAADLMGTDNHAIANAYCPLMETDDLYAQARIIGHQGFVNLLSVEKGLERCPT